MDIYISVHLRLFKTLTGGLLMYRLTTAVFNLGGLGVSHHRYFGLHQRGLRPCGRGQLATFYVRYPQSGPVAGDLGWGIYLSVGWSVAGANLCTQYHTDSLVHFNASFTAQFCHSVYHISSTFLWVWLVHQ